MRDTHRLKQSRRLLDLIRRDHLSPSDLCYPMYVSESPRDGEVLPDIPFYSLDSCLAACEQLCQLGVPAIMVFDIVNERDPLGLSGLRQDGFTARLFGAIKKEFRDALIVISNSGLCSYRQDGSCVHHSEGQLRVAESLGMLANLGVAHARFGADVIGLPEMVDGQVAATRAALDEAGLREVPLLSMVKGDSCLFNPFAAAMKGSEPVGAGAPSYKHRTDPLNMDLFAQKIALEVEQGVDIITIKPASYYLDLVRFVADRYRVPIAPFQVSGEYLMLKLAARSGCFTEHELFYESISCMKRAGAHMIITYHAMHLARALTQVSERS